MSARLGGHLRGGALACVLALGFAFAAPAVQAQPVGGRFAGMEAAVQPFVDRGQIAGAVMLVADKDRVLHLSAVGQSDLAAGRAMKTDDIFWIASMTKPMVGIAVGMLVDEGKLSFDDPMEKYLPEFKGLWVEESRAGGRRMLVPAARPVTVRDLLTHTSGMGEYPVTEPHWTSSEMTKVAAREPLRFQPGTRWSYSTAGIDAVSRLVEVVSGESFDRFLQARLFDPLGMKDTGFWIRPEWKPRLAASYRPGPTPGTLVPAVIAYMYGGAVDDTRRPALGGAGLFSTAQDVARVYQMMLNGGVWQGRRLLKPETVATLTRNQIGDLTARPGMPWGYGFSVIADPTGLDANNAYTPGTFGHGGAFGTQSWADPGTGLVHVFMIQRAAISGNPDNSDMRRAYERVVAAAVGR
jgi:CubicO group peptidase (beta-lactamase class C family)